MKTNLLLIKHPDLQPYVSFMTQYSSFDESGKLIERWIKDETDTWHDITYEEILKQQILDAQRELDKLSTQIDKETNNVGTNT